MAAARSGGAGGRSCARPASSGPRPSRCSACPRRCATTSAARCPAGWRIWSRCPASAARRPTSCSATPSGCRASPWTRTSDGWPAASAGPTSEDPEKVEQDVAGLFPKAEWTMLSHRRGLPRPPDLPLPQARLRRLPDRPAVPVVRRGRDRPGEGEEAAEVREGRAPRASGSSRRRTIPGSPPHRRWRPRVTQARGTGPGDAVSPGRAARTGCSGRRRRTDRYGRSS